MKTKFFGVVVGLLVLAATGQAIDTHWSPLPDPNRPEGTPALWSIAANWTAGVPNSVEYVAWISTANTAPCLLEGYYQIDQLKLGEGGDGSNNGHLIVKGTLDTNPSGNWSGIGAWGGNVGTLEVDGGVFNTYGGGHLWIGNQGHGTVIVKNGGQLHVGIGGGAQMGHGWDGGDGWGRTYIYDGLVTVNNWTTGSVHPNTASFIDIEKGTLSIAGYRFGGDNGVDVMAQQGRITGFRDASFDKKITLREGDNAENDIINNVHVAWDAENGRTIVTAIHPMQPQPYLDETVVVGTLELAWNNWDPNHPGAQVTVDVWFGKEPNMMENSLVLTGANVTDLPRSSIPVNVPEAGTYYWRVDTDNGAETVHTGDVFMFEAVAYKPPILTARSVFTTMDLLPATIPATITDNTSPITTVEFVLLEDDFEFPAGAAAVLTNTTVDTQNPTATLTTDKPGTYKVELTISDDTTTRRRIIEVVVYDDACQAKKDSPTGWAANYYDRNGDCLVDLSDFVVFAAQWLDDTSMQAQETRVQPIDVQYLPHDIFNARIEAESVDPMAVSNAPLTDDSGVRIVNESGATGGGQALGWTGNGTWAEYEITVPAAGVYDVWLSIAGPETTAVLHFGTEQTPDLYGSVGPLPSFGGWGIYGVVLQEGALSFDAPGTYTVRITWTNQVNLDWFALVQQ